MSSEVKKEWSPVIVAFLCNWCSYAGADLAGTGRMQYPPTIRVIRVPCSGRVNPLYIVKALAEGADGVMVSGCHPGDCHYLTGNLYARRRFNVLKHLLRLSGFHPDRVQFTWVSASEGNRFAEAVTEVTDIIRKLGPNPMRGGIGEIPESGLKPAASTQGNGGPASVKRGESELKQAAGIQGNGGQPAPVKYCEPDLRKKAAELLESGEADLVLGLRENEEAGHPTPVFIRRAEDAGQLVWNENCYTCLAVYLNDLKGKKTAIAAKPGDRRSINNLLAEKQIREDEVIVLDMEWDEEETASVTDWMEDTDPEERFSRFMGEIDKCTLCFACRQACPNCYCESCYLDRKATPWELNDKDRATKVTYHLTRAMHLAGRCSGCGACRDVCEFGVDLLYLMRGVREFLDDHYDFRAGEDPEAVSAMNSYGPEDAEIGFLGGEN